MTPVTIVVVGHKYQESKCKDFIDALEKCCDKFWSRSGVCSGIKDKDQNSRQWTFEEWRKLLSSRSFHVYI